MRRTYELPQIRLAARLFLRGKPPAATLSIDGRYYVVRKGDRLTVERSETLVREAPARVPGAKSARTPRSPRRTLTLKRPVLQLRVVELTASEVRVQIVGHDEVTLR